MDDKLAVELGGIPETLLWPLHCRAGEARRAGTALPDPRAVQLWQQALGERWNLTGRVIVSEHGINATLGGTVEDLKQYVKTTRRYPGFEGVDVKWSDGTGRDFPRLSVKVRPELVAFGVPDEIAVDEHGAHDELVRAVAERSAGRSLVAAERMVGSAKPTPTPPINQPGSSSVT